MKDLGGCIDLVNIGDILYRPKQDGTVEEITVIEIEHLPHSVYKVNKYGYYFYNRNIGSSIFKTKEEANEEIRKREAIKEKKKKLKEYEKELNEKFGIEGHFIIK